MKQEKLLNIGWVAVNAAIILEMLVFSRALSAYTFFPWIGMLFLTAYLKWKSSKMLSISFIVFALFLLSVYVYFNFFYTPV